MHAAVTRSTFEALLERCIALARFSNVLFALMFSGAGVALSVLIAYLLICLGVKQGERAELLQFGAIGFIWMALVAAPLLETLLLQQLPIVLARRLGMSSGLQLAIGAVPFAAAHFTSGLVTGLAAGAVGGLVLSLAYLTFIGQSKMKAFCMTASIHALQNVVPVVLYFRGLH